MRGLSPFLVCVVALSTHSASAFNAIFPRATQRIFLSSSNKRQMNVSPSLRMAQGNYADSLGSPSPSRGLRQTPDVVLTAKTTARLILAVGSMQLFLTCGGTLIYSLPSSWPLSVAMKKVLLYFLFGFLTFGNYKFAEVLPFTRRRSRVKNFERSLKRPSWAPKAIVFPIVWLCVKTLWTGAASMVFLSLYQVAAGQGAFKVLNVLQSTPMILYVYHLSLADIWNDLYVREAQLGAAVTVLAALWMSFVLTAKTFLGVRRVAGLLYIPSIAWITIAMALSISIWSLNGKQPLYIWNAREEGYLVDSKPVGESSNYLGSL